MRVEGLWPRRCLGVDSLAKVAMGVSTDVAEHTREVTGVEPESRPRRYAGRALQRQNGGAAGGPGAGKAKPRSRESRESET